MKKNILKTTALFIVLSGLLSSCTLFEDDSSSEIVTAVTTKTEAAKKAVLSLSVAGEDEARTALPSVSSAQEFESLDFGATSGVTSITKSWTSDSTKSAYSKMLAETFEMDTGAWNFTLTAKKGGMTYTGTLNKELVAGANSIEFTLALSELSNEGKGSVEIKLSVPQCVVAVTATLCDTSENEVSDSSITQSTDLANNIVNYSAQNVPSGTYLVVFNLYADTSKTLLLGKWREYAGITSDVTSKSEIAIAAGDLDKVYTISYELNGGTLKENWAGSYTRRNFQTPTSADFESRPSEFLGWYMDENFTNPFNSASLTGNLTLYARWKTISVDELIESIKNKSIGDKAALVGEITSERLSEIVAAMNEAECYLALDLSMTNGLISIGNEFKNCQYLTGISIPKTVTSIGYSAFSGCSGLTEMTIPFVGESVSATGEASIFGYIFGNSSYTGGTATRMFYSYLSYDYVTYYIPSSLKTVTVLGGELKYGAFYGCSGLESVTIGDSVTSIGESAFSGCSGLESVTIGDSVTSIDYWAFRGCSGLTSVTIPNSVTSIGKSAFSGCSGLTEMTIPFVGDHFGYIFGKNSYTGGTATKIYDDTYYIPSSLKSVTLSEGMTSIGESAFYKCSGLESVTIPSSVTSIGNYAFRDCSGLKSVYYEGTLKQWLAMSFKYFYQNPCCNGSDLYIQGNKITDLVIPEGVTSIGKYAFYHCSGLESVTIPGSVTSIWHYAFYKCSGLKSVTIPSSVTSIWDYAFKDCSGLKSVTIPGSVTSMGIEAFSWCSGLESVMLSEGLRSIGERAFWGCSGLESVTIPSSVTSIRQYAFDGCSKLTSLTCLGKNRWNVGGHTGISITVSKVRDKYLDMDWTREQSGGGSTQIGNVSNLRCTYLNMTKGSRKIILTWSGEATSLSFKYNSITVNQKNVDFSANKITLYEKDGDGGEYSVYCPNLGNSNSFVFIVNSESINVSF